jgi:hypothetical protein
MSTGFDRVRPGSNPNKRRFLVNRVRQNPNLHTSLRDVELRLIFNKTLGMSFRPLVGLPLCGCVFTADSVLNRRYSLTKYVGETLTSSHSSHALSYRTLRSFFHVNIAIQTVLSRSLPRSARTELRFVSVTKRV